MTNINKKSLSFGNYLRTKRLEKNIRLEDISEKTRIRIQSLNYIENEETHNLPEEVFVKGFLRAYAKVVGADGDEAVRLYLASLYGKTKKEKSETEENPVQKSEVEFFNKVASSLKLEPAERPKPEKKELPNEVVDSTLRIEPTEFPKPESEKKEIPNEIVDSTLRIEPTEHPKPEPEKKELPKSESEKKELSNEVVDSTLRIEPTELPKPEPEKKELSNEVIGSTLRIEPTEHPKSEPEKKGKKEFGHKGKKRFENKGKRESDNKENKKAESKENSRTESDNRIEDAESKEKSRTESDNGIENKGKSKFMFYLIIMGILSCIITLSVFVIFNFQSQNTADDKPHAVNENNDTPVPGTPAVKESSNDAGSEINIKNHEDQTISPENKNDSPLNGSSVQSRNEASSDGNSTNTLNEPDMIPGEAVVVGSGQISEPTVKDASNQKTGSQETSSKKLVLKIKAVGKTWMRVVADDKETKDYILNPGDNREIEALSGFQLTIGNIKGVNLTLNDAPVSLSSGERSSGGVLKMKIP